MTKADSKSSLATGVTDLSDAADIFGGPVADAGKARESFAAGGLQPSIEMLLLAFDNALAKPGGECDFAHGHCQLSKGHVLPHCVPDPDGSGSYLMVDDQGRILREL
jgi:hypothetical protein